MGFTLKEVQFEDSCLILFKLYTGYCSGWRYSIIEYSVQNGH